MKRRTGFFLILAAAIPLAVASTAYACANLATLYLNKSGGKPGTVLKGDGRNYASPTTRPPAGPPSQVTIRLDSRTGKVLWQGPAPDGRIQPRFAIPRARAGYHTLLATQQRADGRPHAGTPGRATIKISGRTSRGAVAAPWGSTKPEQPGGTGGASPAVGSLPSPVTLGGFLLALALAGSGVLVLAGARRGGALAPTPPTG